MKTIAFYSYKGGVGRTLALSNIAKRLVEFGKRVCIVDFDLEAPGLHCKFRPIIKPDDSKKGMVDYIYDFSAHSILPDKITPEYYYDIRYANKYNKGKNLFMVPAGNIENPLYWKKLSGINWYNLFYGEEAEGIPFFLDWKAKIERDLHPDYLLIDTRTGVTDITNVTLSLLADRVVFLAANNEENISGCRRVIRNLLQPANNLLHKHKDIILVLTRIPYPTEPAEWDIDRKVRDNFASHFAFLKEEPDIDTGDLLVLHSDRALEIKEELKIGYTLADDTKKNVVSIAHEYLHLFERVAGKDLTPEERQKFDNIRKAQALFYGLIDPGLTLQDKISQMKEIINLVPDDSHYRYNLGSFYWLEGNYKKALEEINKALKLEDNLTYRERKIWMLYQLDKYEEVLREVEDYKYINEKLYLLYFLSLLESGQYSPGELLVYANEFVERFPESAKAYNCRADILMKCKKYKEALLDAYKARQIEPDGAVYYLTLAEIRYLMGDVEEFYMNVERALELKMNMSKIFEKPEQEVYSYFYKDERFRSLLEKYGYTDVLIHIDELLS
ncbi:MAG: AAA family ATPase [Tannerellaceae bacterium]|nr:AAA family ATPase [Tannerellaceae bacterium]